MMGEDSSYAQANWAQHGSASPGQKSYAQLLCYNPASKNDGLWPLCVYQSGQGCGKMHAASMSFRERHWC